MITFVFVFAFMVIVVLAMSIGVMMSGKKMKGSCGGVGNIPGMESQCSCDNPCDKKQKREAQQKTEHKVNFPA